MSYRFLVLTIFVSVVFMSTGFTIGQKNSNRLEQGKASFDNATDSGKACIVIGSISTIISIGLIILFFYQNRMLERRERNYRSKHPYQFTGI